MRRAARPVVAGAVCIVFSLVTPLTLASAPASATTATGRGGGVLSALASELRAGSSLAPGQSLVATGGRYRLEMQDDGNLVVYWISRAVWSSRTAGHGGAHATLETNGDLVVSLGREILWTSKSGGHAPDGFAASMLRSGDVVIASSGGHQIWSSDSATAGVRVAPEASPAFAGDAGDPQVIEYRSAFYAFTTGTPLGNHIQVLVDTTGTPQSGWRSYAHRTYGSTALPSTPKWEQPNTQTSPGVIAYGGHWLLFYDASLAGHRAGTGYDCLSVATASSLSPTHPVFTDSSTRPLLCQASYGGVLDPMPFFDARTRAAYLIWKSNDGSSTQRSGIWSAQLSPSGTTLVGPLHRLLYNDTSRFKWETTLDDPDLFGANGRFLLIFSVGSYLSAAYAESFALCQGPTGPCTQPAGGPFLESYAKAAGPGGGALFADQNGNAWLAYEAWSPGCTSYSCGGTRRLFVAPFDPGV